MSSNMGKQQKKNGERRKTDVVKKPFPLDTLIGNYMILSQIISKLDRQAYLRLIRTNKTMLEFSENYKSTIKFNLLRGETLEVKWNGITFGKLKIKTEAEKVKNEAFNPVCDLFEISLKGKGKKKQKFTITKREFCKVLRGCCPKELVYSSPHEAHYDLLQILALAPCFTISIAHNEETVKRMVAQFRPRELKIIDQIASQRRGSNQSFTFETLCSPEFQGVEVLRINNMRSFPEAVNLSKEDVQHFNFNPQRMAEYVHEQTDKQIAFGLGGVMDRVTVFEMEIKEFTSFPVMSIRKCVENWCAGRNKINKFAFYQMKTEDIHIPEVWDFVCNIQATAVMYNQLPPIMKAAFVKECFGKDPADPAVEIRLLTCPTKKKTAYIYTSPWGTISFRTFDFYPEGN